MYVVSVMLWQVSRMSNGIGVVPDNSNFQGLLQCRLINVYTEKLYILIGILFYLVRLSVSTLVLYSKTCPAQFV